MFLRPLLSSYISFIDFYMTGSESDLFLRFDAQKTYIIPYKRQQFEFLFLSFGYCSHTVISHFLWSITLLSLFVQVFYLIMENFTWIFNALLFFFIWSVFISWKRSLIRLKFGTEDNIEKTPKNLHFILFFFSRHWFIELFSTKWMRIIVEK